MANNIHTYQQVRNVSINKEKLLQIASNEAISKKDFRVLLCLFTQLDGWAPNAKKITNDPLNYKKIDVKAIASAINLDKKEVKKAINNLMDALIIEQGDSDTLKNGYRFTF